MAPLMSCCHMVINFGFMADPGLGHYIIYLLSLHLLPLQSRIFEGPLNMSLLPLYEGHVVAHVWNGEVKRIFFYDFKYLIYYIYIDINHLTLRH